GLSNWLGLSSQYRDLRRIFMQKSGLPDFRCYPHLSDSKSQRCGCSRKGATGGQTRCDNDRCHLTRPTRLPGHIAIAISAAHCARASDAECAEQGLESNAQPSVNRERCTWTERARIGQVQERYLGRIEKPTE